MRTKLVDLETAAKMVKDDATIIMSAGFAYSPMAILREIVRRGPKNLHQIGVVGGSINLDLLIGSGQTSILQCCGFGFEPFQTDAPNFNRFLKARRIYAKDNTCGILYSMVQAGSMGVPYVPVRGLAGTDVLARRDDMMIAHNPFDPDEKNVVAISINPDVAICHAIKADKWGNAVFRRGGDEVLISQASDRVIVTAEEIVDEVTAADPDGLFISSLNVTAVVHAPHGAHPSAVPGKYEMDREHIKEYIAASASDETFKAYLDKYIYGKTEADYQALVGITAPVAVAGA